MYNSSVRNCQNMIIAQYRAPALERHEVESSDDDDDDNNNNNNKHPQQKKKDINIRDNSTETRVLTDVAISGDRNVIKKEAKNILKYKDLTIEIKRTWNFGDTRNDRGNWNHLKFNHKIPQH